MQPRPEFPSAEYVLSAYPQDADAPPSSVLCFNPKYPESRTEAHDALDHVVFSGLSLEAKAGDGDSDFGARMERPPSDAEYPSIEYVLTIYETGTEIVLNEKRFNPKYYGPRKGAHGAFDWAIANGHDVTIERAD